MQSLKQFWKILKEFFHRTSEINLPITLTPNEPLGRYLLYSRWFNSNTFKVKSEAFLPRQDNLKISVFRILDLSEDDIWKIGVKEVIKKMPEPKMLYGIAEIKVSKVRDIGLEAELDNNPPRHANVIGWPEDKSKRKLMALELAKDSTLRLRQ